MYCYNLVLTVCLRDVCVVFSVEVCAWDEAMDVSVCVCVCVCVCVGVGV